MQMVNTAQGYDIKDVSNARLERWEELESMYGEAEARHACNGKAVRGFLGHDSRQQAEVAKAAERLAGSLEVFSFVLIALVSVIGDV